MKIKKICFTIDNIYPILENSSYNVVGGAEVRMSKYIKYLQALGTSIEVITPVPGNHKRIFRRHSGIVYYNTSWIWEQKHGPLTQRLKNTFYPSFVLLKLPHLLHMFTLFKNLESPVIYKRAFDPFLLVYALMAKITRKKLIFGLASDVDSNLIRIINFWGFFIGITYYLGMCACTRLILQSKNQEALLPRSWKKKSRIVLKGADLQISNEDISGFEKRKFFLWVGRFSREKKPEFLLELAKSNFLIKIAGRVEKNYYGLLEDLKKYSNVEYLGLLPPPELRKRYLESLALLNTSVVEGFPETFIESWTAGTPVISLHFPLEDLLEGKGGVYVNGSIRKMVGVMSRLYSNKDYFLKLSTSSQDLVRQKYCFTREMDDFSKILFNSTRINIKEKPRIKSDLPPASEPGE